MLFVYNNRGVFALISGLRIWGGVSCRSVDDLFYRTQYQQRARASRAGKIVFREHFRVRKIKQRKHARSVVRGAAVRAPGGGPTVILVIAAQEATTALEA